MPKCRSAAGKVSCNYGGTEVFSDELEEMPLVKMRQMIHNENNRMYYA